MPTGTKISVSQLLKKVPAAVRPTVEAVRRTVKAAAPRPGETIYEPGPALEWPYVEDPPLHRRGANVVGIGTFPTHSTLFFYRGRELDDGSGLLQGGGKEMRFITLRAPADAKKPSVKAVVQRAFTLGGSATRLS